MLGLRFGLLGVLLFPSGGFVGLLQELVSDSADGANVFGVSAVVAEFATQVGHSHVDGPVSSVVVVSPCGCDEAAAGPDPTRMPDEGGENIKLKWCQIQFFTVQAGYAAVQADFQVTLGDEFGVTDAP